MKKAFYVIIALILIGIIGALVYYKKIPFLNSSSVTQQAVQNAAAVGKLSFTERYENTDAKFAFSHPTDTKFEESEVEGGKLLIVAHPPSSSIFQIYIRPIPEKYVDISADRLKKDIPDLTFRDPQEVIMGTDGKGLAFISKEGDGEKREVWFALGGFLYQISAPLNSDAFVQAILNTWEFN